MFQSTKCSAGRGCFHRKKATLKVHGEAGWQKHWVWREATILLRHPPLSCDKNATLLRWRHKLRKENSGPVGVFAPAGTPARLVFSHRSTSNLATHPSLATTLQCSCSCLAKPVLNCARIVSAVTTGAPCRAMWQLGLTHPSLHCLGRALIIL